MFVLSTLGNSSELYLKHTAPEIIKFCMCDPEFREGGPLTLIVSFSKVLLNLLPFKPKNLISDPEVRGWDAHPINEKNKDDFVTLFRQHNFTRTHVHSNYKPETVYISITLLLST